jgi:hypothetical protein
MAVVVVGVEIPLSETRTSKSSEAVSSACIPIAIFEGKGKKA